MQWMSRAFHLPKSTLSYLFTVGNNDVYMFCLLIAFFTTTVGRYFRRNLPLISQFSNAEILLHCNFTFFVAFPSVLLLFARPLVHCNPSVGLCLFLLRISKFAVLAFTFFIFIF